MPKKFILLENNLFVRIKLISVLVIFLIMFGWPSLTYAVTRAWFETSRSEVYQDEVFLVDIRIDSADEPINVVEGSVKYDVEKLEVVEISKGGSFLKIWPRSPSLNKQKGQINFIGGAPDGFQKNNGQILRIAFRGIKPGSADIGFLDDISIHKHDGFGTKVSPWTSDLALNILERPVGVQPQDEWQALTEQDKTPPKPFEIELNRDSAVFNNQYFISFFTTDAESGIAYFEVKEGYGDFIQAESPYLLEDQSLRNLIKVRAVDKAGNEKIVELMPSVPPTPFYKNVLAWVIASLIIIPSIIHILWKIFSKRLNSLKQSKTRYGVDKNENL